MSVQEQDRSWTPLTTTSLHDMLVCNLQELEGMSSRDTKRGHIRKDVLTFAPAFVDGAGVDLL